MKICMIAPEQFPLPGSGSVEICMLAIAAELAAGHEVTLVSRRYPGLPHDEYRGTLRLVRLPASTRGIYSEAVKAFLDRHAFDVVQVDNRPKLMAAVKRHLPGTPVILFLHSLTFVPPGGPTARCLAKADRVIANSESLRLELQRRFRGIRPAVVPLGADLTRFVPAGAAEQSRLRALYRQPPVFNVLFAGRVIPRKGVPVVIRAAAMMKRKQNVHLIIAGRGPDRYVRRLKAMAARLGVSAHFAGDVPHSEIQHYFRMADCFVCPSQRHEAFGLVNVEAMACGLPVVASSIGGIREIIQHGRSGYLVKDYRRARSFAARLLQLAREPDRAALMGAEGRSIALEAFGWSRSAGLLERLYAPPDEEA